MYTKFWGGHWRKISVSGCCGSSTQGVLHYSSNSHFMSQGQNRPETKITCFYLWGHNLEAEKSHVLDTTTYMKTNWLQLVFRNDSREEWLKTWKLRLSWTKKYIFKCGEHKNPWNHHPDTICYNGFLITKFTKLISSISSPTSGKA